MTAAGQVIETRKPHGARLTYAYDKTGLLKRIESFTPENASEDVTRFWYDQRGLLIQAENKAALIEIERDKNGRIVEESLNGKRIKSGRDSAGNRILREIVGHAGAGVGGDLARMVRDPLGAVEKLNVGDAQFSFTRDALGRQTRRETGRGGGKAFALDQQFDAVGQLTSQSSGSSVKRHYDYDRAFAPVRIDDTVWGETKLAYDANGQLGRRMGHRGRSAAYDAARNVAGASVPAIREGYGGESYRASPIDNWQSTPGGVVKIAYSVYKGSGTRLQVNSVWRLRLELKPIISHTWALFHVPITSRYDAQLLGMTIKASTRRLSAANGSVTEGFVSPKPLALIRF
jgi:YD repeat-containing protein